MISNFTMVLDYEMGYYDEASNYALALSRLEAMTAQKLIDGKPQRNGDWNESVKRVGAA